MMSYLGHSHNRNQAPLTLDMVRQYAPSAFATQPHESRSDRYTYIPTVSVIEGMMKAGFQPFSASQSRSRIEGKTEYTKHMIRFRHSDVSQAIAVGDVLPEVILVNSHDGTSAYKLIAGFFRLVCSNGLMVADSTVGSVSVMHKGNIIQDVIEASNGIIEQSGKALTAVGTWGNLQLTSGEQNAFAEAAHTVRFADSEGKVTTPITAAQLLQPRRSDDVGADLWKTFNRVQENVIKGGLHARAAATVDQYGRRQRGRLVSTRQVKGIDQDVRLNRALWQLAERMSELKVSNNRIEMAEANATQTVYN
jgi:hypothetical protein